METMGQEAVHILKSGTMLHDRYVIEESLGEGGFGITYKGTDQVLTAEVAVKEYFPQGLVTRNNLYSEELTVTQMKYDDVFQQGKERFLKEARMLAKFNREAGVVSVTDFFEENNTAYIVMEYLEGTDLKKYLKEKGSLTVEETLGMMTPIIEALDAVHSNGLIHRDISPDNIMLLANGGVKLMDFGAARDYTEFGRKSLSIVLKHGYAPEEQYRTHGQQGPWTDIYALCATMYKCITGQTPVEALERMQNDTLRSPADLGIAIPPQVNYAIMRGLAVRRQDRYQDLKAFCEDLYGDGSNIDYNNYYENGSAAQGGDFYNGANYGGYPDGNGYGNPGIYGSNSGYPDGNGYGNTGNYGNSVSGYPGGNGYGNTGNYGNSVGSYRNGGGYPGGTGGQPPKKGFNAAFAILVGTVVILIIGIGFLVWQLKQGGDTQTADNNAGAAVQTEAEATTEAATETEATTETTTATTEEETQGLPFTDNVSMNIDACLAPDAYQTVTSGDGAFHFAYPKYMFSTSYMSDDENSYELNFDDGIQAHLAVWEEAASGSAESNVAALGAEYAKSLNKESGKADEAKSYYSCTIDRKTENGCMARIEAGHPIGDSEGYQYNILASDGSKNYILQFYYKNYGTGNQNDRIDYITECIYRSCSFGFTKHQLRTYQDYMNGNDN